MSRSKIGHSDTSRFELNAGGIVVKELRKSFRVGNQDIEVLRGINLEIEQGEFVVIYGPSGCGKSTLLHVMLGLEDPTSGDIDFMGVKLDNKYDEDFASTFRKKNVGIVYQQPLWVKSLSVRENVAMPLMLAGENKNNALNRSMQRLREVEMLEWADYVPTELSGGQQQRVAMARALVNDAAVLVADEPTGNLDFESGQELMKRFFDLNQKEGKTVILVTHDLEYLMYAHRAFQMLDGKVVKVYDRAGIEEMFEHNLMSKKDLNGNHE